MAGAVVEIDLAQDLVQVRVEMLDIARLSERQLQLGADCGCSRAMKIS